MPKTDIGRSVAHIPRATELKLVRDAVQELDNLGGKCSFKILLDKLEYHWYFTQEKYAGISSRKTLGYYIKTALYLGLIQKFDKDGKPIPASELPLQDFTVKNSDTIEITSDGKKLLAKPTITDHTNIKTYCKLTPEEKEFLIKLIYNDPGYLPVIYLTQVIMEKPNLTHNELTKESMIVYDSVKIFISGWSREDELDITIREKQRGVYSYRINQAKEEMIKMGIEKFKRKITILKNEAEVLKSELIDKDIIKNEINGKIECDTVKIPQKIPLDHDVSANYAALIFKRFGMTPLTKIKLARGVETDVYNEGYNIIFDIKIAHKTRAMGSSSGKVTVKDVHDFLRYRDQIPISHPNLRNFNFVIIGNTANEQVSFDVDAIRLAYERNVGLIDIQMLVKLDKARQKYIALTEDILILFNELRNIKKYFQTEWTFDSLNHRRSFEFELEFTRIHDALIEATIQRMKERKEKINKIIEDEQMPNSVKIEKIQTVLKQRHIREFSPLKKEIPNEDFTV
ncbi:MAG: hypothetical protein QME42_08100 [bacterium]|nr:hypothetical protein [bacterium]